MEVCDWLCVCVCLGSWWREGVPKCVGGVCAENVWKRVLGFRGEEGWCVLINVYGECWKTYGKDGGHGVFGKKLWAGRV